MADRRPSVLVAMSGGVDSSVAALLLMEQGFRVVGGTMEVLAGDSAVEEAAAACQSLGIPHRAFDIREQFAEKVIEPFCRAYLEGATPNPCVACNRHLKFGALHELRRELGLDHLATGHYARRRFDEATGRWQLLRATDAAKDQSYLLHGLAQEQLACTLFPLGELAKPEVRALAEAHGLACADKPESQDICFVPDGDYVGFIERRCGSTPPALQPGPILDGNGSVIGEHHGIARYTIGQRKGIGVAAPEPLYIGAKDAAANTLVAVPAAGLLTREVRARDLGFVSGEAPIGPFEVQAKTSYRQAPQPARAELVGEGELAVSFRDPVRKAAPGQVLVLYDGDLVLGGGTII